MKKYALGTYFSYGDDLYILARVSKGQINLINIKTGNRWHNTGINSNCLIYENGIGYLNEKDVRALIGQYEFDFFKQVGKLDILIDNQ